MTKAWWRQFAIFLSIAVVSALLCWAIAGREAFIASAETASVQTLALIPRIALGLLIAGLVTVLLPSAVIAGWLGHASGFRGILIATGLGVIMPGGPMTSFPLVLALFHAGADMGALIAFLTSWGLNSLFRLLVWEVPFLGSEFALTRFVICLPLPLLTGLLARRLVARHPFFRFQPPKE